MAVMFEAIDVESMCKTGFCIDGIDHARGGGFLIIYKKKNVYLAQTVLRVDFHLSCHHAKLFV